MKKYFLTFFMSLFSLFAFCQSYSKLWKQVENFEDDGKPKSAYDAAAKILKKAKRAHHTGQMLSARLKMAELHQEWAPDSFFTDILEIEALRAAEKKPEAKAVYASLLAELYEHNRGRSQARDLELTSDDMREWTQEQYDSAAVKNWQLSMENLQVLSSAKSKDWVPFIEQREQSAYFKHDLLHVLWNRAKEQNEDFWQGTRLSKVQLAKAVVDEYKRIGNREAALLVSLDYVDMQYRESDSKLLNQLKEEYADLPLCAEVYLALIDDTSDSEKRTSYARECIARYPKYERIGAVRNKLSAALEPSISWRGRKIYYPGKTYDWSITSRNAQRITLEMYRLPRDFDKKVLRGGIDNCVSVLREKGTKVAEQSLDLQVKNSWNERKDTIHWKAFEPGQYALVLVGEASEPEALRSKSYNYSLFICSRLQPLEQDGLGKQRTIVVDAESGHPIEGAEVEFYYFKNDTKVPVATLTTDREGRANLSKEQVKSEESLHMYRKVTLGDDIYLEAEGSYFDGSDRVDGERDYTQLNLYTDRSIYRPGQCVHVGGIAYHKLHWDAEVVEDTPVKLVLRDANGKEVGTQELKTDEMGKISADFMLPQGGLPGSYCIRGHINDTYFSHYFSVEEYKRPTFEVTMDKAPDMQWPATEITVTGKAVGYNGVPVREGRVTGTYQFTYPWWWWGRQRDSERIQFDTIQTDENGVFSIRVPLARVTEEALWGGLYVKVDVDVLSVAGETRQGSTNIPLCKKPLRLFVNVPSQLDRDNLKPVTMELLSSTGQPTDGKVKWTIYPANGQKRTSDEAVMNGSLETKDKQLTFDVNDLGKLETGQYEFYAKATSGEHSDSTKAYFLVFGMNDTKLPKVTEHWLYCPDATFNADKPARIQIGTSFNDVSFYYVIVAGQKVIEERLITLSDELRVIEVPYEERFGDGASFHYAFVKGGQVFKNSQTLALTQPDRTLKWEWKTFRDRLHPGDTETWTLTLRQPDGKPASAQAMVTLYDASLDALSSHWWSLFIRRAYNITSLPWSATEYYSSYSYSTSERLGFSMKTYDFDDMEFDEFNAEWYSGLGFRYGGGRWLGATRAAGAVLYSDEARPVPLPRERPLMMAKAANTSAMADALEESAVQTADNEVAEEAGNDERVAAASPAIRTNFNETAAFLPRLQTNAKGEVSIKFTLPESLTTWKLLGLAHTKDMMSTTFSGEAIARKELMARLFMPRFLRAGDNAGLRATVQNLTETDISGTALLEVFDPETERVLLKKKEAFTAKANGECLLTFDYTPDEEHTVVAVRLTADSKLCSDGEQHYLPILPSKTYVTESVEIRADSLGTFTTDLTSLFNHNSPTATNRRLTVEYTTHPIWYALQALPSLVEPQYDDIISLGTALQAQSLATYIANNTPRLKELVEIWKREQAQGQPALASRLAEDEELKQIILDETPWLREAEFEADRKARLIQLFNISQQETTLSSIAERMERRLESCGGYSWFPGMPASEVMTRIVANELTRLRVMTNDFQTLPSNVKRIVNHLLQENVRYIAECTAERVAKMKELEKKGQEISTASMMYLQYVYTTQNAGVTLNKKQQSDVDYLLDHMKGSVAGMDNWERAMAAVVMKGDKRTKEAKLYYESLLEHTTSTPDHGTYFDYAGGSFEPTSHKIIHHVAAMEAVFVMEPTNKALQRNLSRWLLQQKRTQMWESNICTVDAIYALFLGSKTELQASASDDIKLNYANRQVEISRKDADKAVSGLGFIKKQFADGEAPKTITVKRNTDSEAWGAVFATYLTPMTDASASSTGMKVRREVNKTELIVGDRMTTRYIITADRDYEYVCLRAARAACMEPAEQYSGYRYQGGLGYYRAVRDAHTDYFFDHMPKGTYVLEETSFIDRDGHYTTGLTTVRCLYAPEYGSNTPALELSVSKE